MTQLSLPLLTKENLQESSIMRAKVQVTSGFHKSVTNFLYFFLAKSVSTFASLALIGLCHY